MFSAGMYLTFFPVVSIQARLDSFRETHNFHRIRHTRNSGRPAGYVDVLWTHKRSGFVPIDRDTLEHAVQQAGYVSIAYIEEQAQQELDKSLALTPDQLAQVDDLLNQHIAQHGPIQPFQELFKAHRDASLYVTGHHYN